MAQQMSPPDLQGRVKMKFRHIPTAKISSVGQRFGQRFKG
eukprot:SAG31_NODE_43874_length_265_cov_0.626506_2_plen_39_part_01